MLAININSPRDTQDFLRRTFREKRLYLKLSQKTLAQKSGVSLGSIKRFESSGEISLNSLLNIALVLDLLEGFCNISTISQEVSLEDIIKKEKTLPKRGRK